MNGSFYVIDRKYKVVSAMLLIGFTLISVLQQWYLSFFEPFMGTIVKRSYMVPLLWSIFILIALIKLPKVHPQVKYTKRDTVNLDAFICGLILIVVRNMIGLLLNSFGKSPYDFSVYGIMINVITILLPTIAREIVRHYIINTYCKKNKFALYIISIVLILFNVNWNSISSLTNIQKFAEFVSSNIVPALCESFLLSYLVLYGGVIPAIIFVILTYVFHYIIPVLPVLNWFLEGVLGIIIPLLEIEFVLHKHKLIDYRMRHNEMNLKEVINLGMTMTFSVVFLWFVVGVFPIYPSVIATGSMEPIIYPGDIILIDKVHDITDIESLKVGDVIQFKRDSILITHRIISIKQDMDGNLSFQTKGDNNSGADSQIVEAQDIKGTLFKVIPKLGYPTLWLKEKRSADKDKVEF